MKYTTLLVAYMLMQFPLLGDAEIIVERMSSYEHRDTYWPTGLAYDGTNIFLTDDWMIEKLVISNTFFLQQVAVQFYSNAPMEASLTHISLTPSNVLAGNMLSSLPSNRFYMWHRDLTPAYHCTITRSIHSVVPLDEHATYLAILYEDGQLGVAMRTDASLSNVCLISLFTNTAPRRMACDMLLRDGTLYLANAFSNRIELFSVTNDTIARTGYFGGSISKPDSITYDPIENVFWITQGGFYRGDSKVAVYDVDERHLFEYTLQTSGADLSKVIHVGNGVVVSATDLRTLVTRVRGVLCVSNHVLDATEVGNTNGFLDPGESAGLQLALENWCWTGITARVWLDRAATIGANQWYDPWWNAALTTDWLVLPSATGYFDAIAHRATGWQTNAFPITLATNIIGRGMRLVFSAEVPEAGANFTLETYAALNNPRAVYAPAQLDASLPHSVLTNFTLTVTNTGTRELVAVYTSAYPYITVSPLTNIVAPGSNAAFSVTIDTAQATATDAVINAVLHFDANEYLRYGQEWPSQTNVWFDDDVAAVPLRLVISANTPPVWHMQTYYTVPETTDVYIAVPRYTNHWYLTNKYVITLAHDDAQTPETNLVSWYMSWPAGQVLVTQENLFARMWPGSYYHCFAGTISTGIYDMWVRDDGVPQLASTTRFYTLRTQVNQPPNTQLRWPNVFATLDPITNCWFDAYDYDRDTLTIDVVALPPGAYALPQTNTSWVDSWTKREWRWDSPVEGIYTAAFVVIDDGIPSISVTNGKQVEVLPECGLAGLGMALACVLHTRGREQ